MFLIISAKQQLGCDQLKNAAHQEMSDFGFVNVDFFSLEQAKLDNEWANVKEVNFTIFVQICFIQELPSDNTRMNTEMSNRSKFASPKRVASALSQLRIRVGSLSRFGGSDGFRSFNRGYRQNGSS